MQNLNWKEIVLAALTVLAGVAVAFLWRGVFDAGSFGNYYLLSLPVVAVLAYAVLFGFSAIFIRNAWLVYIAAFIPVLAGYFLLTSSNITLGALAIALALQAFAMHQIRNESHNASVFNLRKFLRSGLPIFFTALALSFSVFYLNLTKFQSDDYLGSLAPKDIFEKSLSLFGGQLNAIVPGFDPSKTLDDTLLALAKQESGGEIDPAKLTAGQKQQLLQEGYNQLYKQFGIRVTGKEKGADLMYDLANQKLGEFAGPYKQYIPYISAFGIFLTVKFLSLPLYWTTIFLCFILVRVLAATGFLKREKAQVEVERLAL
jgi:hypothetical protein